MLLESFLMTFRCPGAHARTALPLLRELDLEGSVGSRKGLFLGVLFGHTKNAALSMSFIVF